MKLIFKTLFGSHLYGTDTPTSDRDYKGVYIEPLENINSKKDKEVITENTKSSGSIEKNKSTDTDTEIKELRRFLKDCMDGQTYALDMLFSSDNLWLQYSREWVYIISHREKLLSKNVQPYIGYCRQQAGKYGLKGSRLGELLRVIEFLKQFKNTLRVEDILRLKESEFVKNVVQTYKRKYAKEPITEYYLEVLGKKFEHRKLLKDVLPSLEIMNERYGERARMAERNEGVDWKAISHAYRCCYQLYELATTGKIIFPLQEKEKLVKIKKGELDYVTEVQGELPKLMEKAIKAVEKSKHLFEQPDREFWDKWLINLYTTKSG